MGGGDNILRPPPAFVQAALERAKASAEKRRKNDWCTMLERNERGEARATSANALIALQNAEELQGIVAIDEMEDAAMVMRALPDHEDDDATFPRLFSDVDVTRVQVWIQQNGIPTMTYDALYKVMMMEATRLSYHPVKEWLTSLRWDGVKRIDTLLPNIFMSHDTPYARDVGRKFLIAMVARVMNPGCKMDYMLILEGKQGVRKSTACNILGGPWFSDSLPDLRHGGKDVSQHIKGKWLIEVAEMSALDKSDANALKSFITRAVERYRPSYGRTDIKQPRQCVFVGTTNQSAYLRDETGARRFWPIEVGISGPIDIERLTMEREQLFAEALAAWENGEKYWPTTKEQEDTYATEQEKRQETDEWGSVVMAYLMDKQSSKIRILDIAEYALDIKPKDVGTTTSRRLASIMRKLGWERTHTEYGKRWVKRK
ncbi:virulence-associated E family protein [Kozakia baliensis]|uniref:virulence-associated E family protein n=1 Tax=Kozakia baliensis TaxID=153496 RepID=UPI0013623892|nr:virulence-associated E family protein [Kozakia baliensis]